MPKQLVGVHSTMQQGKQGLKSRKIRKLTVSSLCYTAVQRRERRIRCKLSLLVTTRKNLWVRKVNKEIAHFSQFLFIPQRGSYSHYLDRNPTGSPHQIMKLIFSVTFPVSLKTKPKLFHQEREGLLAITPNYLE